MSENSEQYRETINEIRLQTQENLWTMPLATLLLLLFAVLFLTLVLNLVFFSFGWFALLVYPFEIIVPLVVLYLHRQKVRKTVREKISEMDSTKPGILEAYDQWHSTKP